MARVAQDYILITTNKQVEAASFNLGPQCRLRGICGHRVDLSAHYSAIPCGLRIKDLHNPFVLCEARFSCHVAVTQDEGLTFSCASYRPVAS